MTASAEIVCTACGAESLVVRQAVYEGFKKVGEEYLCAACGYVYPTEAEVPFKARDGKARIFSEEDRPQVPKVFAAGENRCMCRYCASYVVNPFTQWCSVHRREVEATDTCDRFTPRENKDDAAPDPGAA